MGTFKPFTASLIASGSQIPIISFSVKQSKTKSGDTFRAETAFDAVPGGVGFFVAATNIDAQIIVNGTKIFDGVVDHSDYDWTNRVVTVTGRDKASALVDKTTSQKFLNKQPDEIVQAMASAHGISADVDSPGGKAGTQFTADLAKITHRGSEWSAVNELAELFGMTAYMTVGTLYFKNVPESLPVYQITYTPPTPGPATANAVILKTSRNHILGRPIKTNVHSHNHKKKTVLTHTISQAGSGEPLVYNHVTRPGLTQDQVQRIATKKHADVVAHELSLDGLEIPGDETLNARFMVALSGTGTAFDQQYAVSDVEHVGSSSEGYVTKITCKNKKSGGGGGPKTSPASTTGAGAASAGSGASTSYT